MFRCLELWLYLYSIVVILRIYCNISIAQHHHTNNNPYLHFQPCHKPNKSILQSTTINWYRYPKAIVISDLPHPSEEEEDKLEVATALYKEGFLLIDDEASKPAGAVDRDGGESDDSDDPF